MFQINAFGFFDVLLDDVHVLRRIGLISSDYDSIIFQSDKVSDNIQVVFMKTIVNISDKSISMIDDNTHVRLIHRNNDLFPQWFLNSHFNMRFD